jgi:hypothetical protein
MKSVRMKEENNSIHQSIIRSIKKSSKKILLFFEGIDMTLSMLNGSDKPINKRV